MGQDGRCSVEQAAGEIGRVMGSAAYRDACAFLARDHGRMVDDIVRLTQIASPPFGEALRAEAFLGELRAHGLDGCAVDQAGNVAGVRPGTRPGPALALAAHLDTVFPAGTDVTVRREGTRLLAPGVGDDTRGLAVLLAWLRALDHAGVRLHQDLLVVGDVGEEGPGDLRGMRELFQHGAWSGRIGAFITVDGPEVDRIAVTGIGSRRYRAIFRGPGGHSFGAFGTVSPMFAMAGMLAHLSQVPVPASPRTTFSAGVVSGGTSINSIPNEVWVEVDLRSEGEAELAALVERFVAIAEQAVVVENRARDTAQGEVSLELRVIGDRPAGRSAADSRLVRLATASVAAHGFSPVHEASSTDANIAMSLGIPAIKIGSGGVGGRAHSLQEWIDVEPGLSLRGMASGLATLMAVAGVEEA